ncbi:MAG: 2-hydroxyacid dehydrogenase [Leptotrichiaceae bacterium]|nr:2-hydroxyacid dehydrogenase [Leptotrichiaceae bacterium]MBP6281337.1 2-hydroxyacid dehydrogenase [Leptotrichiaceae bacterium]MBP7100958.1 2-hydroxyacid dehydrogenase [Leptotrichiaceae bacterium]
MNIVVFDAKPYDIEFFEKWNKQYGARITYYSEKLTLKTAAVLTKYQDVVCTFVNDDLNEKVIEILSRNGVRAIAIRAAGYNNVDIRAAYHNRVTVFRVPAYSPYAVAEHALALLMTVNRKTNKAYNRTREGNFSLVGLTGIDLNGKTAGVIGTGKIARIFIKILNGLGMNVIAYDKFPNEQAAKDENFTYVDLEEVFEKSDVISLHCPLLPDTKHIVNSESISKMKKGVIIINSARGGLVNTESLIEGLKNKKIGGAGLDVYENEKDYFFEDESGTVLEDDILARLLTFNNVVVTSHQAFLTEEALNNIVETTLNNILAYAKKEELVNEVWYNTETKKIMEGLRPKK